MRFAISRSFDEFQKLLYVNGFDCRRTGPLSRIAIAAKEDTMTRSLMLPIDTALTRRRLKLPKAPVVGIDVHCQHHLLGCVHT